MLEEEFLQFIGELENSPDNKAISLFQNKRHLLTTEQRQLITETFLIQCIGKIAKLEHVTKSKNM